MSNTYQIPYQWTCDVEADWGGRSDQFSTLQNLVEIVQAFDKHGVKGLFFTNDICAQWVKYVCKDHELGSHGFTHTIYTNEVDARNNVMFRCDMGHYKYYRAPKFSYIGDCVYSNPKNHLSVLKSMWFGIKPKPNTIMYLHPFDFYKWQGIMKPPSLFCRLWYSQPKRAWRHFENLLSKSSSYL